MTEGYVLGRRALQQIDRTVREVARRMRNPVPQRGVYSHGYERRWAVLGEDLLAAVDSFTDPSTAQANFVARKANGDLEILAESVTLVNRFEEISVDAGRLVGVEWMAGEWTIYKADCPAMSASASVPAGGGGGSTPPAESL